MTTLRADPRGRGRPKVISDADQRAHILACTTKLFLTKGYGRTTTEDVAARCRISKQTLYRLFPGKLALFAAIVDSHRLSMLGLPGDYDDMPLDVALEKILRTDIDPESDKTRVAILRMVILEAHQFPELEDILERHAGDRARAELAKWLKAQAKSGRIVIDDPPAVARALLDMVFGAVCAKASGRVTWPSQQQRKIQVRRCISIFLNGIVPRP